MGRTQLPVILMLFCAVKCLAMSHNELEDFAEYITRTSQLSPILRKGVASEEPDEKETISDDAWEESGKFEGDLILNDRQRRMIVESIAEGLARNGVRDETKRWPNNKVIYYIQVEHFSNDQVSAIMNGIDEIAQESCITFRRYRKGDPNAVVIQGNRRGCFSQVGYQGGYQVLNLSGRHPVGRGCFRHGTIVHEMLHTLGFFHMQSSPDRDDYVNIVWPNIQKTARHNFRKYNSFSVSNFGVEYDYDSVLHYSNRAFSINGQSTIVPKQAGVSIGQRIGLSGKDKEKLNRMYCSADDQSEGFVKPKNELLDENIHQKDEIITEVVGPYYKTFIPKTSNEGFPPILHNTDVSVQDAAFKDIFDRVSKIINSHVYPSQTPDLSIYTINNKYTPVVTPQKDKKDSVKLLIAAPVRHPRLKTNRIYVNKVFDLNNPKSTKTENQYQPKTTIGHLYEEKSKDEKPRAKLIVDPSYTMTLSQYEDQPDISLPKEYREQDELSRYSEAGAMSFRNHDDYKYTPYEYTPYKYNDGDDSNASKHSSLHLDDYKSTYPFVLDSYSNL